MPIQIQYRRGTASEWTSANPTLALGEPGYETDTGKAKVGNGIDAWNDLQYTFQKEYDDIDNILAHQVFS